MQWWTRQQINSRNPEKRKAALERLALRPSASTEAAALQGLSDPDPLVRLAAVEVLTQLKAERAMICLVKSIRHLDPIVRERIARALGCYRDEHATEALRSALRDTHDGVRTAAARGLEGTGWRPTSPADQAAWAVSRHDFNAASACGAAAIEPLLTVLGDTTYSNRRAAVTALAAIGDTRATKALITSARDPDPSVRVVALEALGELREPTATEALRAGLRDSNANVRAAAAESLGRVHDLGAVDLLERGLTDGHWEVRKASVEALGRLKSPHAVSALVERLSDSDDDVRLCTVDALGQFECGEAKEALIGALVDAHAPIRRSAESALRRIDARWEQSESAHAATAKLKLALNANDYPVRQAAADLLMKIGGGAVVERLPSGLSHASGQRRQAALEVFKACLDNADRDLRLAAVEALGRIMEPQCQAALQEVAADPSEDRWVRAAAESILPKLLPTREAPELTAVQDTGRDKIVPLSLWDREAKQRSS